MIKYIVGVDEAGRGPLAGPVAVGVACVPRDFKWGTIPGVGDSKQVTERKREVIFSRARVLKKTGALDYAVSLVGAATIDRIGITRSVALGISRCLARLGVSPSDATVLLDGLLKAPEEYKDQKTIIKGDATEKIIGLASIMAKVTRDRYMVRIAPKYPRYSLEVHKGYGTQSHREAIGVHGLSPVHRRSFCRKFKE